jgi:hypothetical protein
MKQEGIDNKSSEWPLSGVTAWQWIWLIPKAKGIRESFA